MEYLKFFPEGTKVLDVGSMDVGGGNYRILFEDRFTYTGLDIAEGKNVDIVSEDPYSWPVQDGAFDVVVSGQCLEHIEAPWLWMKEINRVCKKGGIAIIIAPWSWRIHRYPLDCWRILPDGMSFLLSEVGSFDVLKCDTNRHDCFGVGRKR
jgi:SAM-dependent methyltransferase